MNFTEPFHLSTGALSKLNAYTGGADLPNSWDRMLRWIAGQDVRRKKIALPSLEGYELLCVDDIIRLTADGSYTQIFPEGKSPILVTRKLGDFEKQLEGQSFFRIHRSHLINLNHLVRYHKGKGGFVIMSDGEHVDVSKRKREAFLELLKEF
ncbi:MAG: LytTR family DNA-binding domain-containing protein [Bacteroidota bacterium]